jgi:starvation-inducible DNA-binding protein
VSSEEGLAPLNKMQSKEANDILISHLVVALSDVVTFYFQAHGSHWNVKGPDFQEYHELFEEIYEDVYSSIDPIAENIRKLDHDRAPFELSEFSKYRTFEDVKTEDDSSRSLTEKLHENNDKVLETLVAAFHAANHAYQQGIMNFLAERIDMHQKWA